MDRDSLDTDVAVVGAGAVGSSVALHLARLGHSVTVLEKESAPAHHQSGRNSGVIHAGYNLKPGSAKARFCAEGNRRLRAYCRDRGVPLQEGGILVVARTDGENSVLKELLQRAKANRVAADLLDADALRRVEPHASGIAALHAPEGASLDAKRYVEALVDDARTAGARFRFGVRVAAIDDLPNGRNAAPSPGVVVRTNRGRIRARVVVNCAGLHADRLAAKVAPDVRIVPFRGFYAELVPDCRSLVRSHIYAAPNLQFPFLGVHLSRRTDGRVIVGPGAMLALGREAYRFHEANLRDLGGLLAWPGFWRLLGRSDVRHLVRSEVSKSISLDRIWQEARLLVPDLRPEDLVRSYAGNRAQLVSRRGELIDDIVVGETPRALHVLNAVSPGLTCSLPFGEHLAERASKRL